MDENIVIEKQIIEKAKLISCKINDERLRKRAFVLNIAANFVADYLSKAGIKTETKVSLYRVAAFAQNFELADIYVDGKRLDIRVTIDGEIFGVPKAHKKYEATPCAYVVLQMDRNLQNASILGFVATKDLPEVKSSLEYFEYGTSILQPLSELKEFLSQTVLEQKIFSAADHERIKELSIAFIDGQISESEKVYFIKHVISCPVCREIFCDINDFDMVVGDVKNYPELLEDSTLSVLAGNKQEVDNAIIAGMTVVENEMDEVSVDEIPLNFAGSEADTAIETQSEMPADNQEIVDLIETADETPLELTEDVEVSKEEDVLAEAPLPAAPAAPVEFFEEISLDSDSQSLGFLAEDSSSNFGEDFTESDTIADADALVFEDVDQDKIQEEPTVENSEPVDELVFEDFTQEEVLEQPEEDLSEPVEELLFEEATVEEIKTQIPVVENTESVEELLFADENIISEINENSTFTEDKVESEMVEEVLLEEMENIVEDELILPMGVPQDVEEVFVEQESQDMLEFASDEIGTEVVQTSDAEESVEAFDTFDFVEENENKTEDEKSIPAEDNEEDLLLEEELTFSQDDDTVATFAEQELAVTQEIEEVIFEEHSTSLDISEQEHDVLLEESPVDSDHFHFDVPESSDVEEFSLDEADDLGLLEEEPDEVPQKSESVLETSIEKKAYDFSLEGETPTVDDIVEGSSSSLVMEEMPEQHVEESIEPTKTYPVSQQEPVELVYDDDDDENEEDGATENIVVQSNEPAMTQSSELSIDSDILVTEKNVVNANDDAEIQQFLDEDLLALLTDDTAPSESANSLTNENENVQVEQSNLNDVTEQAEAQPQAPASELPNAENIETLYENENQPQADDSSKEFELAQEPVSAKTVSATKRFLVLVALFLLVAGGGAGMWFMNNAKNQANNYNDSMNQDAELFDMQNRTTNSDTPAVSQDINKSMTNSFSDKPAAITITKLSWQISEKLATENSVKEYLQTAGKNIQMNLQNDLSNSADVNFNNLVKVSFEISPENELKGIQVLESSGSDQIDDIIVRGIKNTLKYVSVPKLKDYNSDYFLTLIINF